MGRFLGGAGILQAILRGATEIQNRRRHPGATEQGFP